MVTTLIEWDTMSCSSRAMRVRSSATSRSARAIASAARWVRSRTATPTDHGPTRKTRAAATSLDTSPRIAMPPTNGISMTASPT